MVHFANDTDDWIAVFDRYRPRLFGIAYRMLGTVADAEDVVQDAWVRWQGAEASAVRSAEAWLVAATTRLAIDRLRRLTNEREAYVGQWLPEPLSLPAPDRGVELASDLSMAFLVLLERLGPEERAAFLLREVFDAGYDEIARTLDKSEAACRQLVHRARERVRRPKRRFEVPGDRRELVERSAAAVAAEDREGVLQLLADDAVFVADGGGKIPAMSGPARGGPRLAQLLTGFERMGRVALGRRGIAPPVHEVTTINGDPAILTTVNGRVLFATLLDVGDDGRITTVYRMLNPDKLARLGRETLLPVGASAEEVQDAVRAILDWELRPARGA